MVVNAGISVMMLRRKQIIHAFRNAGAIDENNAIELNKINIKKSQVFKNLIKRKMIIRLADDRYYLNEPVVRIFENNRRYFLLIVFIIIGVFVLLLLANLLR